MEKEVDMLARESGEIIPGSTYTDEEHQIAANGRLSSPLHSPFDEWKQATEKQLLCLLEQPHEDIVNFRLFFKHLTEEKAEFVVELLEQTLNEGDATERSVSRCQHFLSHLSKYSGVLPHRLAVTGTLSKEGNGPIAGGSFADVWHGSLNAQKVAIKAFRTFRNQDSQIFKKSFFREVLLWRQLCHENVLPFLGFDTSLFPFCVVSPWMENGNMVNYLENNPEVDRLKLLLGVASGLTYLHEKKPPIIHGDLKGDNIVIDDHGNPLLCDFGVGRYAFDNYVKMTMSLSNAIGCVSFVAPELLDGQEEPRPTMPSDIYAFGGVCYQVFTGKPPFAGKGHSFILRICEGEIPQRPSVTPPLSDSMWDLMEKSWKLDPSARPLASQCCDQLRSFGG